MAEDSDYDWLAEPSMATMLHDPITRALMRSDSVAEADLLALLAAQRQMLADQGRLVE
ncbi:hypothetical protein [Ferrovibrio sp.]|uniref:hypothetical protein n=1 Tax=Ferrovibrio sp. TaxID=1917215 RepID=UPI0025C1F252|nr:hypothetical protein [Ferrovibrio sp.]MBX3454874.1 hypothetical protein [Ferrovibrio sp.]